MSDDRPTGPERDRQQRFEDALDDLFGADEPESPRDVPQPATDPVYPGDEPFGSSQHTPQPEPSYPIPTTAAPARQGRSVVRTLGISCAVVVALIFFCFTALAIIGFLTDGDTGASPAGPTAAVSSTTISTDRSATSTTVATISNQDDRTPLGAYVNFDGVWRVAIIDTVPDATDLVLDENMYNERPDAGWQFFMATVSVENTGSKPDVFAASYLLRAIGESGQEYTTFDDYCGVVPDPFPGDAIPPGTVHTGNICWSVRTEDVNALVMRVVDYLGEYQGPTFVLSE